MEASTGFIRRGFEDMLQKTIPCQMKRMCLIASLTANIRNTYSMDRATLKCLNETMALSGEELSILVPVKWGKNIWYNHIQDFETIRSLLKTCDWSKEQIGKICNAILDLIPSWLWYGNRHIVATDVELLLRHHKTVFGF